jgi:predicted Fe-Mo cluster-binding NifX family protein
MKVAVSASGPTLDSEVDPRLGRCSWLLIVDTESMMFDALENPAMSAPGGAGIQVAEAIAQKQVEAVITGNCGPNAFEALSAAGIHVYAGASGSAREAVESFLRGELAALGAPSVELYSGSAGGMLRSPGRGLGGGMGRGLGGGMGRGLGRGLGRGQSRRGDTYGGRRWRG